LRCRWFCFCGGVNLGLGNRRDSLQLRLHVLCCRWFGFSNLGLGLSSSIVFGDDHGPVRTHKAGRAVIEFDFVPARNRVNQCPGLALVQAADYIGLSIRRLADLDVGSDLVDRYNGIGDCQ
jgi:hypothetical protein